MNPGYGNGTCYVDRARSSVTIEFQNHPNISVDNIFVRMTNVERVQHFAQKRIIFSEFLQVIVNAFKREQDEMQYKIFLNVKNITVDYCNYTRIKSMGSILLELFASGIRAHGNVIRKCPITGLVYLRNYTPDLSSVPFYVPHGEYLLQLKILSKKSSVTTDLIGGVSVYTALKPI